MGKYFFSLKGIVSHLKSPPLFLCWVHQPSIGLRVVWEGTAHCWGECRGQRGLALLFFWVWLMWACWSVFVRAGMWQTLLELFLDQIYQRFRRGLLQIHKLQLGQENTNCLQFSFYPFSPPSLSVFPHWIIFHLSGNVVKCLHEFQWKCHYSKNA